MPIPDLTRYKFAHREDDHTHRYYIRPISNHRTVIALIRKKKQGHYSFSSSVRKPHTNHIQERLVLSKHPTAEEAEEALLHWVKEESLRLYLM